MAAYGCIFQPLFGCCALQMLISFNKSLVVTFKLKQAIDIDMLYEKQFFEFKINVVSIGALLVFFNTFSVEYISTINACTPLKIVSDQVIAAQKSSTLLISTVMPLSGVVECSCFFNTWPPTKWHTHDVTMHISSTHWTFRFNVMWNFFRTTMTSQELG